MDYRKAVEQALNAIEVGLYDEAEAILKAALNPPQRCVLLTPKDSSEDCFNRR